MRLNSTLETRKLADDGPIGFRADWARHNGGVDRRESDLKRPASISTSIGQHGRCSPSGNVIASAHR